MSSRRFDSIAVGGLSVLAAGIAAAQSPASAAGGLGQVLRAFDAETGEMSEPLGATVQHITITYAVDGRQYVAVVSGEQLTGSGRLARPAGFEVPEHRGNSLSVFALPEP